MEQIRIDDNDYEVLETCASEMSFEGDSKGFEGAVGLKDSKGELFMLGLCEGNHCQEKDKGRERGHGVVVVMRRVWTSHGTDRVCVWKTVRSLSTPASAHFQDYSSISVDSSGRVAITSQEESKLWLGRLSLVENGVFDPSRSEFIEDSVLDFPRGSDCSVVYCNIEGIHWLNKDMLVAVSDKMKSDQDYQCLEKDQSIHVFVMP